MQLLSQEEKAAADEDAAKQSAHEIAKLKRDYEAVLLVKGGLRSSLVGT